MYIIITLIIVTISLLLFFIYQLSLRIYKLEGRYRVLALQYNDYMEEMIKIKGSIGYVKGNILLLKKQK